MEKNFTYTKPVLRYGVLAHQQGKYLTLAYRDQGCDIAVEGYADEAHKLLSYLMKSSDKPALTAYCHENHFDIDVQDFVNQVDQLGLLQEMECGNKIRVVTGSQAYRELKRFIEAKLHNIGPCALTQSLVDGKTKRNQMIGYVCEYFQVVRHCPQVLAPALTAMTSPQLRDQLLNFYLSEARHDRIIFSSLDSVAIRHDDILLSEPLPWTFSLIASLSTFSRQHIVSLLMAIYLFERPQDDFYELFSLRAQALNMPSEFIKPLLKHANINNNESHENIAKEIFSQLPCVNEEDIALAKQNALVLIEMLYQQSQEICTYYAMHNVAIPRLFYKE